MKLRSLRTKTLLGSFLLSLTFLSSGCIYLIVGGVGALGGYVVSPDTVEGVVAADNADDVWDAAVEVISIMGVIQERSKSGGLIIAKIQGTKVTVNVFAMSSTSIKLTVKARKSFLPKIRVAQDVYAKIVNYLEQ